jgi:hypothetical protein
MLQPFALVCVEFQPLLACPILCALNNASSTHTHTHCMHTSPGADRPPFSCTCSPAVLPVGYPKHTKETHKHVMPACLPSCLQGAFPRRHKHFMPAGCLRATKLTQAYHACRVPKADQINTNMSGLQGARGLPNRHKYIMPAGCPRLAKSTQVYHACLPPCLQGA